MRSAILKNALKDGSTAAQLLCPEIEAYAI